MAGCRAHYNIYAWIIAVVMCVSYLGVCGLYNPNVRNYSAHSVSLLGESRTGNSEESIDDTWMLSAVLAALLLSLIFCVCASAGRYPEMTNSRRWILLEYIHRSDGKKRAFIGI